MTKESTTKQLYQQLLPITLLVLLFYITTFNSNRYLCQSFSVSINVGTRTTGSSSIQSKKKKEAISLIQRNAIGTTDYLNSLSSSDNDESNNNKKLFAWQRYTEITQEKIPFSFNHQNTGLESSTYITSLKQQQQSFEEQVQVQQVQVPVQPISEQFPTEISTQNSVTTINSNNVPIISTNSIGSTSTSSSNTVISSKDRLILGMIEDKRYLLQQLKKNIAKNHSIRRKVQLQQRQEAAAAAAVIVATALKKKNTNQQQEQQSVTTRTSTHQQEKEQQKEKESEKPITNTVVTLTAVQETEERIVVEKEEHIAPRQLLNRKRNSIDNDTNRVTNEIESFTKRQYQSGRNLDIGPIQLENYDVPTASIMTDFMDVEIINDNDIDNNSDITSASDSNDLKSIETTTTTTTSASINNDDDKINTAEVPDNVNDTVVTNDAVVDHVLSLSSDTVDDTVQLAVGDDLATQSSTVSLTTEHDLNTIVDNALNSILTDSSSSSSNTTEKEAALGVDKIIVDEKNKSEGYWFAIATDSTSSVDKVLSATPSTVVTTAVTTTAAAAAVATEADDDWFAKAFASLQVIEQEQITDKSVPTDTKQNEIIPTMITSLETDDHDWFAKAFAELKIDTVQAATTDIPTTLKETTTSSVDNIVGQTKNKEVPVLLESELVVNKFEGTLKQYVKPVITEKDARILAMMKEMNVQVNKNIVVSSSVSKPLPPKDSIVPAVVENVKEIKMDDDVVVPVDTTILNDSNGTESINLFKDVTDEQVEILKETIMRKITTEEEEEEINNKLPIVVDNTNKDEEGNDIVDIVFDEDEAINVLDQLANFIGASSSSNPTVASTDIDVIETMNEMSMLNKKSNTRSSCITSTSTSVDTSVLVESTTSTGTSTNKRIMNGKKSKRKNNKLSP